MDHPVCTPHEASKDKSTHYILSHNTGGQPRRWRCCKGCCDGWTRSRYVYFLPRTPLPHSPSLTNAHAPTSLPLPTQGLVRAGPAVSGQESATAHLHPLPAPALLVPLLPPLAPGTVFERLVAGGVWGVLPPERLLLPGKVRDTERRRLNERIKKSDSLN